MIIAWVGVILGLAAILGGNTLEGGHLSSLLKPTAAVIVFGGTFGATILSSTFEEVLGALKALKKVFLSNEPDYSTLTKEVIGLASGARKDGILSLESKIPSISNPFLSKNLQHIIDGYDPNVLKEIMEDTISDTEEGKLAVAKVWETAGGYSPTIGIIGAVMGLIHVMSNLSDSSKLGAGIAVAFVATIYGVAAANLFFLPVATKLKKITKSEIKELVLIYTGLIGIQSGLNPRVIEDRLNNLTGQQGTGEQELKRAA